MHHLVSTAIVGILAMSLTACGITSTNLQPSPAGTATAAVSSVTETPEECLNPYFPVVNGARWVYGASEESAGSYTRTITGIEPDGLTSRATLPGGGVRLEQWQCDDGIIAQQPRMGLGGTIQPGDDGSGFQLEDTSGVTVPDNLGPDAFWNQESTWKRTGSGTEHISDECQAGATELVTVPAGRFNALRADCRSSRQPTLAGSPTPPPMQVASTATIWYASGVGIVRVEYTLSGHPRSVLELTSYRLR